MDENGQIIRRDESRPSNAPSGQTGSPHEVWYRFAGRELGYAGNNGTLDKDYAASIADRQITPPSNAGTYRNGQLGAVDYADFAQSYDPVNSYSQGASVPGAQTILDGSLSFKTAATPQIVDFSRFGGGARTTIIAPSGLPWGSYGIIQ